MDELTATALTIRDEGGRMEVLVALAVALAEVQEYERATVVAQAIPHTGLDDKTLCSAVKTLVKAQLLDNATTIALSISDERQKDEALAALIHSLVGVQAWDKANELAQSNSRGTRFYALATVARARAEAQPELALELLTEMEGLARADFGHDRDNALRVIAMDMASAHLWDKATAVARSINTLYDLDDALSSVIEGLTKARLWDKALAIAWSMRDKDRDEEKQVKALRSIVRALEAAGHHERATELLAQVVKSICYEGQKDLVLAEVAEALIEAKLWDIAEKVIRSIRDPKEKCRTLAALATAIFKERPEEAKTLVSEAESIALSAVDTLHRNDDLLWSVAKALVNMGFLDRAITTANLIIDV